MSKSRVTNMTQGNPAMLLAVFALPMLLGNIFQQAYTLADSVIVGRFIGASALAAVGSTGSVTFLFFSVCNGIASGASVVTAQFFGADDAAMTKRAIANAAYIMFSTALVMGLLSFLAAPRVLLLTGTPEDILPDAITYMRMSCLGVPLVAVYNYASSMLRALGDSRTPLVFLIVSCILNIALDLLCVCVFHMGVFGAALATIISQVIAGAGCLMYALRHNAYFSLTRQDMKPDRGIILRAMKLGLPMALQWSLIAVSTTVLQAFINSFGTVAVAAFTATSRIESLAHQPYGSLSAALATYSGQNYGANRIDRLKLGFRHSMLLSAAFTLCMFLLVQLFSRGIVSIFVTDQAVIDMGARALRLTSWFYIFLALIYMTRGVLNGIGDALFALINGVVEVLCRIFIPMLLVLIPAVGLWGIWWTAGITWMISALFCLLRYFLWHRKLNRSAAA